LDWAGDSLPSGDWKALNAVEVKCSGSHKIAYILRAFKLPPMIAPSDPTLAESRIQLPAERREHKSA